MFLDDLEPLKKSFYRPKNQYSRLEQIIAVLIVFLPVATVRATVPATVPATVLTKRQNTGNLHLEPCKIIF